jgi:DNA-binding MarR family transcriptional regulator/GNAT superfamily N-acetyltransferase
MTSSDTETHAANALLADTAAVRAFNRFYTRIIGLLDEQGGTGASALSLTQVRLLYELHAREGLTARTLAEELGLDTGYLSRLLGGFERRGLIRRDASREDAREKLLGLTAAGRRLFQPLFDAAQKRIASLLAPLAPADRQRLIAAMSTIRQTLSDAPPPDVSSSPVPPTAATRPDEQAARPRLRLRRHRAGDIGWMISLHGELYQREYGLNIDFERLVAGIGIEFLERFDPARERAWIAELDGERVGCALVVSASPDEAKLRLVLVHPRARGLGLGRQLVREAISFARRCGYRKMTLWTNDCLHAARAIYSAEGFSLISEEPHHSFGRQLNGQYWSLALAPVSRGRRAPPSAAARPASRVRHRTAA